ncbi:MAG TPA: RidA family protein [Gemmatimonadales bacterium]|nr:RidA family protein [Gemmatimonadales bacterium]
MSLHTIRTDAAPAPRGHYSQAVVHAGVVHVAGQLAIDPATGNVEGTTAEAQADRTLRNLEAILHAAGSGLDLVLHLQVHVTAREDWPGVDAACRRHFGPHRPARAIVGGAVLREGCRVEMTATAALRTP